MQHIFSVCGLTQAMTGGHNRLASLAGGGRLLRPNDLSTSRPEQSPIDLEAIILKALEVAA
jgi:hypothetical protein